MAGGSPKYSDFLEKYINLARADYHGARLNYTLSQSGISDEMREAFFSQWKHLLKYPTDATQEIALAAAQVNQVGAGVCNGRQTPIDEEQEIQNVEETTDQNFVSDDREREIRNVAAEDEKDIQEFMSLGEAGQQENEIQDTAADDQEDSETHFPPVKRSEKTAVEKPQKPTHHVEETTQETEREEESKQEDEEGVVSAMQTPVQEPQKSTDDDVEKTTYQVTEAEESTQEENETSVEKPQKSTEAEETTDKKVSDEGTEIQNVPAEEVRQEERAIQEVPSEEARQEERNPQQDYETEFPPLMRRPRITRRERREGRRF